MLKTPPRLSGFGIALTMVAIGAGYAHTSQPIDRAEARTTIEVVEDLMDAGINEAESALRGMEAVIVRPAAVSETDIVEPALAQLKNC